MGFSATDLEALFGGVMEKLMDRNKFLALDALDRLATLVETNHLQVTDVELNVYGALGTGRCIIEFNIVDVPGDTL